MTQVVVIPMEVFAAISILGTTFIASFLFIGLKAFQQRNVAFDNYVWVVPTSVAMAAVEVYVVVQMAHNGWSVPLVMAVGLGSGVGALAAMLLHKKFVMKKGKHK